MSVSIDESMKKNQITYLSIGVPVLLYNVLKAILLFKSAHKVKRSASEKVENYLMSQNHLRPQYNTHIAIPKPDFQDSRNIAASPGYYNEFAYISQDLHPVYPSSVILHQKNQPPLNSMLQ